MRLPPAHCPFFTEYFMTVHAFRTTAPSFAHRLEDIAPIERIEAAYDRFGKGLILTTSFGIQSAAMLHLATRVVPDIPVVFVDTEHLLPETYRFADDLTKRLDLNLYTYRPRRSAAMQVALDGERWDGDAAARAAYKLENKVEPMQRAVRELGATAWLSGVRSAQSDFRKALNVVEEGDAFTKIYPIIDWSSKDIYEYLTANDLPYHPLFDQGYVSVGDWHESAPGLERGECGLHDAAAAPRPIDYQI